MTHWNMTPLFTVNETLSQHPQHIKPQQIYTPLNHQNTTPKILCRTDLEKLKSPDSKIQERTTRSDTFRRKQRLFHPQQLHVQKVSKHVTFLWNTAALLSSALHTHRRTEAHGYMKTTHLHAALEKVNVFEGTETRSVQFVALLLFGQELDNIRHVEELRKYW